MTTPEIYNLDATALFYARPVLDRSRLVSFLHEQLGGDAKYHMQVSPLSHDDWWLLACNDFHIMISFSNDRCHDEALGTAAASPVTTLKRFDYLQVVQSHNAHLKVEIGDGHAPLPPEARLIMQELSGVEGCDPALKMRALQLVMQYISTHEGYLALFFGPSERLFSPEEFTKILHDNNALALLTHPVPTLPEIGPNGREGYHVRLKNPGHLDGPALELEGIPTAIPLATAVTLLTTLMNAQARGKITLTHGKVFKPSQKVSLYVREVHPDDAAPNGKLILSFWSCMGHDTPLPPRPKAPEPVAAPKPEPVPEPIMVEPERKRAPELKPEPKPEIVPEIISVDPEEEHKYAKYMTREEAKISRTSVSTPKDTGNYAPPNHHDAATPPAWQLPQKSLGSKLRSAGFAMTLGFGLFFVPIGDIVEVLMQSFELNEVDLAGTPLSGFLPSTDKPVN